MSRPMGSSMMCHDDETLFGQRRSFLEAVEQRKAANQSNCAVFPIGTFDSALKQWGILNLTRNDKRTTAMFSGMGIEFPLYMQSHCWQKMAESRFSVACIAPEGTGKTYAHLLFAINSCIMADPAEKTDHLIATDNEFAYDPDLTVRVEEENSHPRFIIVCSSEYQVEELMRHAEKMKENAYTPIGATAARCRRLSPVIKSVNIGQEPSKLEQRCGDSHILIGAPQVLKDCFGAQYLSFDKCEKVIFDDLDLTLQLHNATLRDLIKVYLSESLVTTTRNKSYPCVESKFFIFSRKWTALLMHFIASVIPQITLMFGSLAEAAVYAGLKFELQSENLNLDKLDRLASLIEMDNMDQNLKHRIAIVCRDDAEARLVSSRLQQKGFENRLFEYELQHTAQQQRRKPNKRNRGSVTYVLSDQALDLEVDSSMTANPILHVSHLIHYSYPDDLIVFHQRFRIMAKSLINKEKHLMSTLMMDGLPRDYAKFLFDLFCRSKTTLSSTKSLMWDLVHDEDDRVCWRYATAGTCRLDKTTRDDKFGAFCGDRHRLIGTEEQSNDKQVLMIITHVVSPNEFYFWQEGFRTVESDTWIYNETCGSKSIKILQKWLDAYKDAPPCSTPLERIRKGLVYGVYFHQEARVDRVLLLDEPKHDANDRGNSSRGPATVNRKLEYSKQVRAFKCDYGTFVDVFVKNIILLSNDLMAKPQLCHRGFNLGIKPTHNEPSWTHIATKAFIEACNRSPSQRVTGWKRLSRDNCTWFDNLQVSLATPNLHLGETVMSVPNQELLKAGLAVAPVTEPEFLDPSQRDSIMSKWHADSLVGCTSWAGLRADDHLIDVFVLDLKENMELVFRKAEYNSLLINLEDDLLADYREDRLQRQSFLAENVACVARSKSLRQLTLNRAVIIRTTENITITESGEYSKTKAWVYYPDHGDYGYVSSRRIFQIPPHRLAQLPFQAITGKLAHVRSDILTDKTLNETAREFIMDATRDNGNEMRKCKCRIDEKGELYLYVRLDTRNEILPEVSQCLSLMRNISLHDDMVQREYCSGITVAQGNKRDEQFPVHKPYTHLYTVIAELLDVLINKAFATASARGL